MIGYLFIIVVAILWAGVSAYYGGFHERTCTPMSWSLWGYICGAIALAGAIYIEMLVP